MLLSFSTLGVVPILVNVSAPLLPALAAGLVSLFSLLLRPRELAAVVARRPLLYGAAFLLLVSAGVLASTRQRAASPAPASTDWAEVARGILAAEAHGERSPGRLAPRWQFRPEAAMVLASPVVSGRRVFGASALVDVAGTFGAIFSVDSQSGERIWQVENIRGRDLKAIFSSPAVSEDGQAIIVGEGLHFDKDCALICLDAATGSLRWRVQTPLHIESTPAVRGDRVVVGVGAIEPAGHAPATGEGFVLCVRISDGQELWRFPLIDAESSPVISDDGTVYAGSGIGGNAVVALRGEGTLAESDRLLWKTTTPYPVTAPIGIAGETIYAGAGRGDMVRGSSEPAGAVLALERRTGRILWQAELADAVLGGVVAHAGRIFAPVRNGELVALDAADGSVLWRQRVSGSAPLLSTPRLAGGWLYVAASDGVLAVVDPRDGTIREKHLLNASGDTGRSRLSLSAPVLADGRLFVGSETGGLRCFDTE